MDTMKNQIFGEADVPKKFGVRSEQILDYLAVVGDKVHNIKGIDGLGPKSAQKLLAKYDTVLDAYKAAANGENVGLSKTMHEKLIKGINDYHMAKKLTTLYNLDLGKIDTSFNPKQNDRLLTILQRLEFSNSLTMIYKIWNTYKK
jgi:DNA polymerase-1